ncbi:MAG: cytochrome c [Acidobacteriota bacterium]
MIKALKLLLCLSLIWLADGLAAIPRAGIQQKVTPAEIKESVKNWVRLCAPCHNIQATGTAFGPPLLGPKAKRRYSQRLLVSMFAKPEAHGLSEAAPALRKLNAMEREKLAAWFVKLKGPNDIVVDTDSLRPPPFIFVQNCGGCHGPDATGGIGPNLHQVTKRRSRDEIIKLIEDPPSAGIKAIMPPFDELSEEERAEIADWLATLE